MKEVFISYSTVDTVNAETVRNVLEKNGLSCWMAPRDIPGGSNYTKEIPIAIRNCKVFVLILSKNAQTSQWVLKELDSAVNCGKVILPFMLEDCILNDEFNFLLTGAQRYAAYQKKAEAMETLISRIRGILDAPTNTSSSTEEFQVQPEPVVIEDKINVKTQPQTTPVYLGETVCPACGGSEATRLPRKVKRNGFSELLTMLWIPIFAIIGAFVLFLVWFFFLPYEMFELSFILMGIGIVGGAIWGNHVSKSLVRRKRIRRHLPNTCYRCNSCSKVFLSE